MSKWIDLETDASTGKPYLWKCDECGEEVETRWNYCPECGDPKTSKGKSINTLVKALETEHRKLREMQSATDKNVGTKISRETLELARAIDGLTEWQKHVQTDSNINRDITIAIEALKAQVGTNLAEVGTDTISRQAAQRLFGKALTYKERNGKLTWTTSEVKQWIADYIEGLPSEQPEQRKEILYRHYKGGTYELVCNNVTHTETEESLVIYRDCRGQLWARPESMFYGLVKVGDDIVPRFVLCRSEGDAE